MKTRAPASRDASQWLGGLLGQLAARAVADVENMGRSGAAAVHALRVRMKKLRALLDLAGGLSASASAARADLARRAGEIKDAVSGGRDREVLDQLCLRCFGGPVALIPPVDQKASWTRARLRREARVLLRAVEVFDLGGITWEQLLKRHARTLQRAREAMRCCREEGAKAADEVFHSWRRRVKRAYFQSLALARISHTFRREVPREPCSGKEGADFGGGLCVNTLSAAKIKPDTANAWLPQAAADKCEKCGLGSLSGAVERVHLLKRLGSLLGKEHDISMLGARLPETGKRTGAWRRARRRQIRLRKKAVRLGRRVRWKPGDAEWRPA